MKKFILLFIAAISFSYCTKESLPIEPEQENYTSKMATVSLLAVNTAANLESCGNGHDLKGIPNTEFALFYEENVGPDTDLSTAKYFVNAGSGEAVFRQIEPGMYTVLAKNNLGATKIFKKVYVGSNNIILEF